MDFPVGDGTGQEDMGKINISFGRKVRVKGIQTEKMILLKLKEDGNIPENMSIGQGCKILSSPISAQ